MSCTLEPAICSRDTGQQIPCFDRCQLIITKLSNSIKEVNGKPRLHVSVNLLFGVWPQLRDSVVVVVRALIRRAVKRAGPSKKV